MKLKRISELFVTMFMFIVVILCILFLTLDKNVSFNVYATEDEITLLSDTGKNDDRIVMWNVNELSDIKYIENKDYFTANPRHAEANDDDNAAGTCTTVAMQLLLGYHNYCSDGRIISESVSNGRTFLSEDYRKIEEHPIIMPQPTGGWGRHSIGTQEGVYDELYDRTFWASFPLLGQSMGNVADAVEDFIKAYSKLGNNTVSIISSSFNMNETIHEIDSGNPVVLGFDMVFSEAKSFHVVVAYGYAYHDGEFGFITHYGARYEKAHVWVPADWFGHQVIMRVSHKHNYQYTNKGLIDNAYREKYCEECGCSTVECLYKTDDSGEVITGSNFDLNGEIRIPDKIAEKQITTIGENAFENSSITKIAFSESLTKIEARAFKDCWQLEFISLPKKLNYIGEQAFAGCDNLEISLWLSNNFSVSNNIIYSKEGNIILHSGKIDNDLIIRDNVTDIAPYAFSSNGNLKYVRFNKSINVSDYAFADCVNLGSVEFKPYEAPTVGNDVFANSNCTIFVPYSAMDEYKTAFAQYADRIESKEIVVSFESEGQNIEPKIVHYGETIALTPPDERIGYTFAGWYDNPDYEGEPIVSGGKWECEYGITLYAKWNSDDCKITLDPREGDLEGERVHFVKYGEAFHINVAVEKEGQVFDGWYDDFGVKQIDENGDSVNEWHIAEDITLYAHWRPKSYRIYIDNEGMLTWLSKDGLSSSKTTVEFGMKIRISDLYDTFAESDAGKKEGHIFQRFHYEFSECEKWESIPDLGPDGADIELTPIWRPKYNTIYFSLMYDAENPDPISKNYGEDIELYKPTRTGYVFLGWKKSDGEYVYWVKMPDLNIGEQHDGSVMLSAHWEAITYSVNYNANGGSGNMSPTLCQYDQAFNLRKNTFTRTGHDFMGWSESVNGIVDHVDEKNVINLTDKSNDTVQLYAVWKARTYNIICKNLTADMAVDIKSYTYGEGLSEFMMPRVFRSDGRVSRLFEEFEGWYTSTEFIEQVKSISPTRMEDIVLYAKYDLVLHTIYASNTCTVTDGALDNQPYENIFITMNSYYYNNIQGTTLKNLIITISLDIWEKDDGYQLFLLCNGNNELKRHSMDHGGWGAHSNHSRYTITFNLGVEDCRNIDILTLKFWADGSFSDTWYFNNMVIEARLTN